MIGLRTPTGNRGEGDVIRKDIHPYRAGRVAPYGLASARIARAQTSRRYLWLTMRDFNA